MNPFWLLVFCQLLSMGARSYQAKQPIASPKITPAQLDWLETSDIGIIIHYNIASYIPVQYDGCSPTLVPDPQIFNPTLLDTDNWVQTFEDLGAKYAILVAKHGCGFTTWPTQVRFNLTTNETISYNYSIAQSPKAGTDLVGNFMNSCRKAGIKTGVYYTVQWNNYLNVQFSQVIPGPLAPGQVPISQATSESIALQQLEELWKNYGELLEIWFDGGYAESMRERLVSLLQTYQPNASVLGGFGLTNNSIRNINNEFGFAPLDTWLTVNNNGEEDPEGSYFSFPECTTTLQITDRWFYGGNAFALRPLNELIDAYHATVGHNCKLMLDLAVSQDGVVDARHARKYRQLGDFIRGCYGRPLLSNFTCSDNYCILQFASTQLIDRVVIREDLRSPSGATIRQFTLDVFTIWGDGQSWYQVPSGTGRSIGYKRIILIGEATFTAAVRLNIQQTSGNKPTLAQFDAYLCQND